MAETEKPQRLYLKSYLQLIKNSVGSKMFRNFYVQTAEAGEFDALANGDNACAFFVSAVLHLFKKLHDFHGTVASTTADLEKSGWRKVTEPKPGDVLVWEARDFADGRHEHIGFYIGNKQAISTSMEGGTVIKHDQNFGDAKRPFKQIYRMSRWENDSPKG